MIKPYAKHIFICNNQRAEGAPRICCGEETGNEIAAKFKRLIAEKRLKTTVRAQRASCFDWCEQGPIISIYPEGTIYGNVSIKDVELIFNQHILNHKPVEHLVLNSLKK